MRPRDKGKRGEYFVRDILRGFGYKAERTPMSGAISWMKGDLRTNFPFFIEVKNTKKTTFSEWYTKAEDQSGAYPPIVVWIKSHDDAYCFLKFSDFLMALQGKKSNPLSVTKKPMKASVQDTEFQKFSKAKQLRKK